MSAKLNLRTSKKCTAHAFNQKTLRKTLAIALAFGLSFASLESMSCGQYNDGDLPASPWSRRLETQPSVSAENGSRVSSGRLRPPGASAPTEARSESRGVERQAVQPQRPASVTLMGPILPKVPPSKTINPAGSMDGPPATPESRNVTSPSTEVNYSRQTTASPNHASTQKKPIEAQSDWHRVQAGGQILDADDMRLAESSDLESNGTRERLAVRSNRRGGAGLPDREEEEATRLLPSQTASAKSSAGRDEPVVARSANRPTVQNGQGTQEMEVESINVSTSSRANPNTQPKSTNRSDFAPAADRQPLLVHSVLEAIPVSTKGDLEERGNVGKVETPVSRPANDEIQMKRIALAQRVHHELVSNPAAASANAPEALESLPGWQAVEHELKQRLERCDSLLRRGAVLSAREEASHGLLRLYRTMDLHRGSLFSETAFDKAITAFREEADFQKNIGGRQGSGVQSIVDTHSTEALKGRPLETTSPELAAMHYRWFARYQLVSASDGHPWAADLLYAYGKTLEKDAELNPARSNMFRSQAVVCYQAAMQIAPTQSEVANQLGFALIHLDRMEDAYSALAASIQHNPNANAWNNLAEVFRRRGSLADAEYAVQQATALSTAVPKYTPDNPEITEVDPAVFAKFSPRPTMASPTQNFAPTNSPSTNTSPSTVPSGYGPEARSAKSSNSLFSKIFKK